MLPPDLRWAGWLAGVLVLVLFVATRREGGLTLRAGLDAMTTAGNRSTTLAIWGYSISHLLHIAGFVLLAAGLHVVVHDPAHSLGSRMAIVALRQTRSSGSPTPA